MTPASSRSSAAGRRPGDDRFRWDWHRGTPPGAELLGDLTDLVVAELGSGAGHRAAHLARTGQPAGIVAVDHDVYRTADARAHYGHLPLLRLVQADAAVHMSGHPRGFDVVYSVFGALDFADPHLLLPAVARGLRPGGLLAFSTLAPDLGHPPRPAARRRPPQDTAAWHQLLDRHGFDVMATDTLQGPDDHTRPRITNVYRAVRR
ncbi:class I SAM-dependent methyltransferase [Streptomyces galilaeus]|uniref:class I SAM-dependent methyltransferase n=1 Tax=Streptomyces galilaeus TaxID=33899 RepID=UPI0038F7483B